MLTWLEINTAAIEHNIEQIKKFIGANVLLMPVIKANAYGHGFLNIARVCQKNPKVDRICVVSLDEAIELIKNKLTKKPILILSFFEHKNDTLVTAAKHNIIFPLYNLQDAAILNRAGEGAHKKIKVHIKIDTGTSRLGVLLKNAIRFIEQIQKFKHIKIEGLWSHFASSEENYKTTKTQHTILKTVERELKNKGFSIPIIHIACSAAILNHPFAHENAVRLGLSLYGLYANKNKQILLKPALSWFTKVIHIQTVTAGTAIGYGATYITKKPSTIATLPVGYFDGFDRRLSNKGHVLISGVKCPILGRICMNMCMVDVTGVKVEIGDTATLIGKDKKKTITVEDMATWCNTINYEIVARINPLLPRVNKNV